MSPSQVFLTAPHDRSPTSGPALSITAAIPDLHHYHGRGGRAVPLWLDADATVPNIRPGVIATISATLETDISAEDVFAYVVALTANPAYTARFGPDLSTPGLRVPITADRDHFEAAAEIGRHVIWLQTYGERFVDPAHGRPGGRPRLPNDRAPKVPAEGAISSAQDEMPDTLSYDGTDHRLMVGKGFITNVTPAMWEYEISGMSVLHQWFSYRRLNRERPLFGDKRPPSQLEQVRPVRWLSEYTTDLLDLMNVIGLLIDVEPAQAGILDAVCGGPTISVSDLQRQGAFELPGEHPTKPFRTESAHPPAPRLFE